MNKKLLLLLLTLLAALPSAWATTIYLDYSEGCGKFKTEGAVPFIRVNGSSTGAAMTRLDEFKYKYTQSSNITKFSIERHDPNNSNANGFWNGPSSEITNVVDNGIYKLNEASGDDWNNCWSLSYVKTYTEVTNPITIYVDVSDATNWTDANALTYFYYWSDNFKTKIPESWHGVEMTKVTGNIYKYTGNIYGGLFTRANPDNGAFWNQSQDFDGPMVNNGLYKLGGSVGGTVTVTQSGTYNEDTTPANLYLSTSASGTWKNNLAFTKNNKTFTIENVEVTSVPCYFKFAISKTKDENTFPADADCYGSTGGYDTPVEISNGGTYKAVKNTNASWKLDGSSNKGKWKIVVDFTDSANPQATFTRTQDATTTITDKMPAKFYMSTNVSGNSTAKSNWKHGYEMWRNGLTYQGFVVAENNTNVGNFVYFFGTKVDEWPSNLANHMGYGAGTTTVNVQTSQLGTPLDLIPDVGGYFKLPEKGEYIVDVTFNDDGTIDKVKFTKEAAAPNGYIYFNVGADYYNKDQWKSGKGYKTPYAYFWTTDVQSGQSVNSVKGGASGGVKMTRIASEIALFRAAIPDGATGRQVTFESCSSYAECNQYGYANSNADVVYHSHYAVGDGGADRSTWNKYIYGPGNDGRAHQSYVAYNDGTSKDYKHLYADRHSKKLVFIGHKGNDYWPANVQSNYDEVEPSEGVYIKKLDFNGNEFKMSYVDPFQIVSSNLNESRAWATFNLGILGPSQEYFVENGTKRGENEYVHDDVNSKIRLSTETTYEYNHYNQYNWLLNGTQSSMYIVVDTDYGTACIVPFNPIITLSQMNKEKNEIIDLDDDAYDRNKIDNIVVPGSDEEGQNVAHYRYVNTLSASATLSPIQIGSFDGYDIDYGMIYNGEELGSVRHKGTASEKIYVENIVADESEKGVLFARALFTDNIRTDAEGNNLKFRSHSQRASFSGISNFPTPEAPQIIYKQLYNYNTEEGYYDLLIGITYDLVTNFAAGTSTGSSDYSVYPSYDVYVESPEGTIPATLVTSDNEYATKIHRFFLDFTKADPKYDAPYVQYNYKYEMPDPDSNIDEGSWAYRSINARTSGNSKGYLPLVAKSVLKIKDFEQLGKSKTLKIVAKVHGLYPFHVDLTQATGNITWASDRNNVKRRSDVMPLADDDLEGAIINVPRTSGEAEDEVVATNLSGITDAVMNVGGEGELYNLQGVKVMDAAPAPGIYIRRNADGSASKIVIR